MTLQLIKSTTSKPLEVSDAAEFEAGLTALMPFLRLFAQSLSGKRELAEDLAQAALTHAWRSRGSFRAGTNLKAWLFTILRNEFYSHQRRAWRQIPWDTELVENIPVPPGEQQWAVELSDTACAMYGLPDVQREALILVGVGGLSYEDAAALSKRAVGTMKSRVGRARKSLKKILEGQRSLPVKSRPAAGDAMNDILGQLSHLSRSATSRTGARRAVH
jgi:RNA polymerase sigma-70 factor (ECF subfamily)